MARTKRHNSHGSENEIALLRSYKFKHRTSIGRSVFSRRTDKNRKRGRKKYRGQGK